MKCSEVTAGVEQLHLEFGEPDIPFSHSDVATDLAEIEKHLVAELPVSHRCKENISDSESSSEIFCLASHAYLFVSSRSS